MNPIVEHRPSRRAVLAGTGALIVSFSLARDLLAQQNTQDAQEKGAQPKKEPQLPGSLQNAPMLDSWIRINADGKVTIFSGKSELGQGIKTALLQVAAEELEVDPATITLITSDTGQTPNEGYTAGSNSMKGS